MTVTYVTIGRASRLRDAGDYVNFTSVLRNEAWARTVYQLPNKHYSDYRIEILTSRTESNVSGADEDYRSMAA
jgi:hypothetical protein